MRKVNDFWEWASSVEPLLEALGKYPARVNARDLRVGSLVPTQSKVDPNKSVLHSLKSAAAARVLFAHDPILVRKPIVTLNEKYVIDGHHTWAEAAANRYDDLISCLNLTVDAEPEEVLNSLAEVIWMEVPSAKQGKAAEGDLYSMSYDDVIEYVRANLSDESAEVYLENGIPDPEKHVARNVMRMQQQNPPEGRARAREDMPQLGNREQRYRTINRIADREG